MTLPFGLGTSDDSASGSRPLFPLPLTAFENYMVVDDRASHPMAFVIEVEFSGRLEIEVLVSCVAQAVRLHPLLGASVIWRRHRRCWIPCSSPPLVSVLPDEPETEMPLPRVDIRRGSGLRVWAAPTPDGGRIFFYFHHASTDGLGAMQFIGDVLTAYAGATADTGQECPEPRTLRSDILRDRNHVAPVASRTASFLQRSRSFLRQLGHPAVRMAPASRRKAASVPGPMLPPYVSRTLDRGFVGGLKRAAAKRMLHLNDLFVAALFNAVCLWNDRKRRTGGRRLIRLALPSSLRQPQHDQSPAANRINLVFVGRREADCRDLMALVDRAEEAMNASTHDPVFNWAMGIGRRVPGLMEIGSRMPYCFASMVLTNVGDVKRQFGTRFPLKRGRCVAGSITVESLRGTAPLRPGTHVALSVGTYAGQLILNVTCDHQIYNRQEAEDFLGLFVERLGEFNKAETLAAAA